MQWDRDAEEAIKKVPFFVRNRVRRRVEEEAGKGSSDRVTLAHVHACRERFMNRMEEEVQGFGLDRCFGQGGCPNRAAPEGDLTGRLEPILREAKLRDFLKTRVQGPLKLHHEFRVSVSDCPNACSRPQIADVGFLGARRPRIGSAPCDQCGACERTCRENALVLPENGEPVAFDPEKCLACGQCLKVCPTGTLEEDQCGYRIQVGGRLGRHPRLARELPGIFSQDRAVRVLTSILDFYKYRNQKGERLADLIDRVGWEIFLEEIGR
jgi:NAD-dependent dihydropyrimidine dehydrogenase PreA subunit